MPSAILTIAALTCLEGRRNRLLWLLVAALAAALGLAGFIGEVTLTETAEIQSAVLGAVLRLCAVFLLALFVTTSTVREFNDKGVELLLSFPLARASWLLGKLLGFFLLTLPVAALCLALLLVYVPWLQALLWSLSLVCELSLVIAFSLLCVLTFSQVTIAFSTVAAFYVLARSIAAIQLIGHGPLAPAESLSQEVVNAVITAIAFVLPELHRFTATPWLVYHTAGWSSLLPVAGQTLVYLLLLAGAALFDLHRKNL